MCNSSSASCCATCGAYLSFTYPQQILIHFTYVDCKVAVGYRSVSISLKFATTHLADLAVALLSERHADEMFTWLVNLNCDLKLNYDLLKDLGSLCASSFDVLNLYAMTLYVHGARQSRYLFFCARTTYFLLLHYFSLLASVRLRILSAMQNRAKSPCFCYEPAYSKLRSGSVTNARIS